MGCRDWFRQPLHTWRGWAAYVLTLGVSAMLVGLVVYRDLGTAAARAIPLTLGLGLAMAILSPFFKAEDEQSVSGDESHTANSD